MENQGQLYFGLFLTSGTLLMAIYLLSGFLLLAIFVSMMRIFKKAGKPSISAIVPIWGLLNLFQIAGMQWWYIFIPVINIIMAKIKLAKKFGKGAGFSMGLIFLPMIFIPLLSFYDYVLDDKSKEKEEPVYNPFNQTDVVQVMPETPLTPVTPVVSVSPETVVEEPIKNEEITINNDNVIPIVNETVVNDLEVEISNVSENLEINNIGEVNTFEPVVMDIPEIKEESTNNLEESNVVENLNQNIEVNGVTEEIQNPTIQDIKDALNINKEPVDIAFNSMPSNEVQSETLDNVENLEVIDSVIEDTTEEAFEMPGIAAKVCPACGVSLVEDVKFCTSCGTQL